MGADDLVQRSVNGVLQPSGPEDILRSFQELFVDLDGRTPGRHVPQYS